jgi:hypothetical protein
LPAGRTAPRVEPVTLLAISFGLAAAALILYYTREVGFLRGDWEFLVERRGVGVHALLDPYDGRLSLLPIVLYRLLQEVFGIDSARPYQAASIGLFLVSIGVLFAWLRARVGPWPALAGAVLALFCGAAWVDLLAAWQLGWFAAMAAGLGALLALLRQTRGADAVACALLAVAVASASSLGVAFAVGAAVAIVAGGREPARLYVAVVPIAAAAVWWLGWGHTSGTYHSVEDLAQIPLYVLDSLGASISGLLGLATPRDEIAVAASEWGRPLALVAIAVAAWRIHRLGSASPWLWATGSIAVAFWLVCSLTQVPVRDAAASAQLYAGGILVLLVAAELLRGATLGAGWLALAGAVACLAVLSNVSFMKQKSDTLAATSDLVAAVVGALEIAAGSVDPGLALTEDLAETPEVPVSAGAYLDAVAKWGSPAAPEEEIAGFTEHARTAADRVLATALGIAVAPAEPPRATADCRSVDAGDGAGTVVELAPGGVVAETSAGGPVELHLRRFAQDGFPIQAGSVGRGEAVSIAIPQDGATRPWQLLASGPGRVTLCPPGAA